MKRTAIGVLAVIACSAVLAGCGDGDLTAAHAVGNVRLDLVVPGRCVADGCDPARDETPTLGLLTVTNEGSTAAFLQGSCGSEPDVGEQILTGGKWVNISWITGVGLNREPRGSLTAATLCPTSTPVRIAAGQSLQLNRPFGPGLRRFYLLVSEDSSFTNVSEATSRGVFVF